MKRSYPPLSLLPALVVFALLTAPAAAEEVYFLRGGFDIFSTGMNDMAAQLRREGINAKSASFANWPGLADGIVRRSKSGRVSYPIVILGHSFGGDAAPDFANYLGRHGIPVALVVGFDALSTKSFRAGTKSVVNYRAAGGRYVAGPGFRGRIKEVKVSSFGANHFNLEKNKKVQELALREVRAVIRKRR